MLKREQLGTGVRGKYLKQFTEGRQTVVVSHETEKLTFQASNILIVQ